MTVDELSRIDRTIDIGAPPERVYRALTTASELGAWFQVTIDGQLAVGQDVWMTSVHPASAGQRFNVRIVEMTAPKSVTWEWHPGAVDPRLDYSQEPRTTVRFTIEPAPGGSRLTLSETGFDAVTLARRAKAYNDNVQGWTEVLGWLQRYAETAA